MAQLHSTGRVTESYLARKPTAIRQHSAQVGEELSGGWKIAKAGTVITGQLGRERVQIFTRPARVIEDFVNTSASPGDIARFTRRYGVLLRDDVEWFTHPGEEKIAGDRFCIHCGQWLASQELFRAEWARKGRTDEDLAKAVADQINLQSGAGRVVKAFVRPGTKGGFQLELQPDDLLGALWLAFIGFSDRPRKCQNPKCPAPYFLASRRDQKFCNEQCSKLVANRRWWNLHGAEWRRDHEQARKFKGGK
jgi:hypothetical protein